MKSYQRHYEELVEVKAKPEKIFAFADNHRNFSSHMNQSSWMMAGSKMETEVDEGNGQKLGSHIKMGGKIMGIKLFLDEVITERNPPTRKVWETVGEPKLLVIGPYQLGFEISSSEMVSNFKVFIDYDLPKGFGKILGILFGGWYAKWCVQQMLKGVEKKFSQG